MAASVAAKAGLISLRPGRHRRTVRAIDGRREKLMIRSDQKVKGNARTQKRL
jgi:hypothetical protein